MGLRESCLLVEEPSSLLLRVSSLVGLFLAVVLPFIILTVYAFGKKRRETALISASAGIAVLIGIVLLTVDEKIAPLTVLLLAPLLQWAGEKVLEIQPDRNDETIWAVAAVLSFLAVWIVVRMSFGRSI